MTLNRKKCSLVFSILIAVLFFWSSACAESISPFADDSVELKQVGNAAADPGAIVSQDDGADKPVVVAVLSDLHVRSENQNMLKTAIKAINSLKNIYAVALTGDLCEKIGSKSEYSAMVNMVGRFNIPIFAVPGNHDILYRDYFGKDGKKLRSRPAERKAKLERFRKALKLKKLRYYRKAGGHLLVFLPNDDLKSKTLVGLSSGALTFLKRTLEENRNLPTIIFCHAPLADSYLRKTKLTPKHADAQPAKKIAAILKDNPQVFLWVAGHLHINPSSKDYHNSANKVGKVTVIHSPAVKPSYAWIRVLELSPGKAKVRTYNAKTKKYAKKYDRVFKHKTKPAEKDDSKQNETSEETAAEDNSNVKNEDEDDSEISEDNEADDAEDDEPDTAEDESGNSADQEKIDDNEAAESNDGTSKTTDKETVSSKTMQLIERLIAKISQLLKGLWAGVLKILKS